jgi:hypothetical protein
MIKIEIKEGVIVTTNHVTMVGTTIVGAEEVEVTETIVEAEVTEEVVIVMIEDINLIIAEEVEEGGVDHLLGIDSMTRQLLRV